MTDSKKICLLNPGPVTLTDSVRNALLSPDLCHREPAFTELMSEVRQQLRQVYRNESESMKVVLVTGSGTSAVEAMLGTLVPRDRPALVCANGVYGERMAAMLRMQGKEPKLIQQAWTEAINLDEVDAQLGSYPEISYVVAVHHETTTGRLNDLDALSEVCRQHDKPMLIDAVSSFAGTALPMERWRAHACAATANKCLHGVPGIAFVLARGDVLENTSSHATSLYLDLVANYRAQENGYPAFTPAIQATYALRQALRELESDGGWESRKSLYASRTAQIMSATASLGIRPLLQEGRSDILTSFYLPEGATFESLYQRLRADNFVIYAGQKQMMELIFRISVMGDLHPSDLDRLCRRLSEI